MGHAHAPRVGRPSLSTGGDYWPAAQEKHILCRCNCRTRFHRQRRRPRDGPVPDNADSVQEPFRARRPAARGPESLRSPCNPGTGDCNLRDHPTPRKIRSRTHSDRPSRHSRHRCIPHLCRHTPGISPLVLLPSTFTHSHFPTDSLWFIATRPRACRLFGEGLLVCICQTNTDTFSQRKTHKLKRPTIFENCRAYRVSETTKPRKFNQTNLRVCRFSNIAPEFFYTLQRCAVLIKKTTAKVLCIPDPHVQHAHFILSGVWPETF